MNEPERRPEFVGGIVKECGAYRLWMFSGGKWVCIATSSGTKPLERRRRKVHWPTLILPYPQVPDDPE